MRTNRLYKIAVCLFMAIATLSLAQAGAEAKDETSFDFRQVRWGMSIAQVEEAEKKMGTTPIVHPDGKLGVKTTLNGNGFFLAYYFLDDKLAKATYMLHENFVNKNNYVIAFEEIKSQLVEKYGNPEAEETVWSNNRYKDKPEDIGRAYSAGHVETYVMWENDKTDIEASINGEKFEVNVLVVYESKELAPEFDKRKRNKTKELL